MPRGDKSKYTEKQQRQAVHIEEGYEDRGIPEDEAERRAWATVSAMTGGGKEPCGSGRGKKINNANSTLLRLLKRRSYGLRKRIGRERLLNELNTFI